MNKQTREDTTVEQAPKSRSWDEFKKELLANDPEVRAAYMQELESDWKAAQIELVELQAQIQAMLPVVRAAVEHKKIWGKERPLAQEATCKCPVCKTAETFLTTPYKTVLETE